jgi:isopenicillin N synthase-like dioxygenase
MSVTTATRHAIPTIDLTDAQFAALMGAAAEDYGFAKIVGHGIPGTVVAETLRAAADFFARPEPEKRLVQDHRNNRGFIPMFDGVGYDGKPNGQEGFSMGHPARPSDPKLLDIPFYAPTPWPEAPGFRPALETCYWAMFALGCKVLAALATRLAVAPDFFDSVCKDTYSNMRVLHYPPGEAVAHVTDVGVRPHEDQGLITLLVQDMNGGLEVRGPDGAWLPVVPDPDAVVVNVGKLMTRWTNGRFKSALHRVINRSGRERYSIPLFIHPNFTQVIDPRDLAPGEEPKFEPIVAGERVYENFKKQRPSWKDPVN